MISGKLMPCVQWHGQDSEGNVTEKQMLFPIFGEESQYIECVREDFWRVSYLGDIKSWNALNKNQFVVILNNSLGQDAPIIFLQANELFTHNTFSLKCRVIQLGENGVLFSPHTYHNPDCYGELPRRDFDKGFQKNWRLPYKNPECQDIEAEIDHLCAKDFYWSHLRRRYSTLLAEAEKHDRDRWEKLESSF